MPSCGGTVDGQPDVVERGRFDHEVQQRARAAAAGDAERVVARVAPEEPRAAHGVALDEAEHVDVEVERRLGILGRHDHVAEAHVAGDEFADERRLHLDVVEDRAVEELDGVPARIVERDEAGDPAGGARIGFTRH